MEFFLSASNGILGLPIQACILSHWHASMPTFPSKCRKESEKPTGSSRDKIDGKERGPLQSTPVVRVSETTPLLLASPE